ncbi:ThuA domain-containing protein [bacterium]|nr:ThuA domain-containing protein [bacterium]
MKGCWSKDPRVECDLDRVPKVYRDQYRNHPEEPVAFTSTYQGGRVFYTSLGHPDDFNNDSFCKLLVNAVFWATGKTPIPDK